MTELPRIGAQISTAGGLSPVPQRAIDIGAEVVQIFNTNARMWRTQQRSPEEIRALRDGLRLHDLPLFFHSIYLINLAADDVPLWRRSIDALSEALVLAAVTGAQGVVTHIGSRHGSSVSEAVLRVDHSIRAAYALAEERLDSTSLAGTKTTDPERSAVDARPRLLLETSSGSGTTLGGTLEELQALLEILPACCGVCLDTAHLFAAGYPVHTEEGLEGTVRDLRARGLLSRVGLIHLNDSKTPFGSARDRHENLGDGLIGFEGLGMVVRHAAFRRTPFVLEVPGLENKGPDADNMARAKSMRRGSPAPPATRVPPA